MSMTDAQAEPTLSTNLVYQGKILSLRVDTVQLRNGNQSTREIVEHTECVCVVPLDAANNVVMVRQYRKPVEESLLEIPAGGVEPGETSQEAAIREIQEEIGYTADTLSHLSSFWMTPGFCTEMMHAYLATDLRPSSLQQDEDEDIQVVKVPLENIPGMVRRGEIKDAKSISALSLALYLPGRS